MNIYQLIETDRAGNSHAIDSSPSFANLCTKIIMARNMRPYNVFDIINPDNVDVDCHDGLTDEERELLP